MMFTLSLVILFSTLTVHFRDIQHLLINLLTLWFFSSPIIYPARDVPGKYAIFLIKLNPIAHIVMAYQDLFFFERAPSIRHLGYTALLSVLIFFFSYFVYNKLRDSFVEEV